MQMRALLAAAIVLLLAAPAYADDEPTLATVPPVVVKTEPPAGAGDVPASTTEIRVVFSKKMRDKSWSWVTVTADSFPKTTGQPHYLPDQMTNVLPVALEAGKTYAMWINGTTAQNFQDVDGRKAVPYLLVFRTK
jgi:RNA polymerase sigma-70 factor (ECF subfamily)